MTRLEVSDDLDRAFFKQSPPSEFRQHTFAIKWRKFAQKRLTFR